MQPPLWYLQFCTVNPTALKLIKREMHIYSQKGNETVHYTQKCFKPSRTPWESWKVEAIKDMKRSKNIGFINLCFFMIVLIQNRV